MIMISIQINGDKLFAPIIIYTNILKKEKERKIHNPIYTKEYICAIMFILLNEKRNNEDDTNITK